MKFLKGWKTIAFNAIAGLVVSPNFLVALSEILTVVSLPEFRTLVPTEYLPLFTFFVTVGNMYLRKITNTALGKKS